MIGQQIGPYAVLSKLGEGGMGEVYRARDAKLNRDVALKILPASVATNPDRRARFEREARALAALNHPNIAAIYGFEDSAGVPALVMELVEGPTLADLAVPSGPNLPDTLSIARQLIDALDAAHDAGIVHRDLKPANIKVRDDGTVKVLDFGLAKALATGIAEGDGGHAVTENSPTLTSPAMTEAGLILGTAAYMSPEQARGRPVDKRADIWAFGVIVFEMLSSRRLFQGETVSDTLASVLRQDIPWDALPASTPLSVRRLLTTCLERDPKKRLRDIADARVFLDPAAMATASGSSAAAPGRQPRLSGLHVLLWASSLIVVGSIATYLAWQMRPAVSLPPREFTVATEHGTAPTVAKLSPDGRLLAYITAQRVWIRPLSQTAAREVPGSDDATAFMWSPDSQWIVFQTHGQLWKISASGGSQPVAIATVEQDFTLVGGGTWLAGDRIAYSTGSSEHIMEVSANGGTPKSILQLDSKTESDFHDLSSLPDGTLLFVVHPRNGALAGYTLHTYRNGQRKRVAQLPENKNFNSPAYSPTGHVLFDVDGGVWALPFSISSLEATGEPFLIRPGAEGASVAADGTLVMIPVLAAEPKELVWIDRLGKVSDPISRSTPSLREMRLSADGTRVAATAGVSGNADIYLYDARRLAETRLTYEPDNDSSPSWSKDGQIVTYACGPRLCQRRFDGTDERTIVLKDNVFRTATTPSGSHVVMSRTGDSSLTDVHVLELGADGRARAGTTTQPFLTLDRQQRIADVSPDGRFAVYDSNESGRYEIFATRFPKAEGRWPVSRGVGYWPRWSTKGDRIFYVDDQSRIVEVDVTVGPTFEVSVPRVVVDAPEFGADPRLDMFERSLDGQRFLVARTKRVNRLRSSIYLIENWPEWLRGKK